MSVRARLMVAALACFALAFGAFLVFLFLRQPTLAKIKDLTGLCSLDVALVGVGVTVRAQRLPPVDPAAAMPSAERQPAAVVRAQWRAEASGRGLLTNALHVRWASTSRPIQADPATIMDDTRVTGLRWGGDVTEAAHRFRQLPARRLVVVGDPGSGKSSLAALLVCGLLSDRAPDEPVPILLTLAGWDTRAEHLDDWMARRLEDEYPLLRDRRSRWRARSC